MTGRNPERVAEALASCESFDDVRARGVLFHGTCEEIAGPLKGGPYDGVFWTAETPSIAQAYIPRAGIRTWISKVRDHERDDKIRPGRDALTTWALEKTGARIEDLDVEWDRNRAKSWRIPAGWPTLGDFDDHLRELGYAPNGSGIYDVSEVTTDAGMRVMPADWRLPGKLIVILAEDLKIETPRWSEEALGYSNHNRVGDFARFAAEGVEAIRMSDQLQSDHMGNVGHAAIGVLPAGLKKLSWMEIPAVRHDGDDMSFFSEPETEEFRGLMARLAPDYGRHERCPSF